MQKAIDDWVEKYFGKNLPELNTDYNVLTINGNKYTTKFETDLIRKHVLYKWKIIKVTFTIHNQ